MSLEHIAPSNRLTWLKPTYRTLPEQMVGLAIFLTISFSLYLLKQWMIPFSLNGNWYKTLVQAPWVIHGWPETPLWSCYHFLLPLSIWTLWRRISFFKLKLELSVFLAQLLFQGLWILSFFYFREPLLSLTALLFLCFSTLLSILLFGRKERAVKFLLIPSFLWIFYIMGINMTICVFNP